MTFREAVSLQDDTSEPPSRRSGTSHLSGDPEGDSTRDPIAFASPRYVIAPLLAGYSAYSLVTGTHKGWYSWIVSSCVGFIYAFGFVMMTPQLYINYRLESVEHLPWRAMVYKSLNTFIDDLFAFIIKMPTMHRLSCLRDLSLIHI